MKNCGNDVTALKARVLNAGVSVTAAGLKFSDGSSRSFRLTKSYPANYESKWVDVAFYRGLDPRCVVAVFGTAQSTGGTATAQIFGNIKSD